MSFTIKDPNNTVFNYFLMEQDSDGKWVWSLNFRNKIIARSAERFDDKAECKANIRIVRMRSANAEIDEVSG